MVTVTGIFSRISNMLLRLYAEKEAAEALEKITTEMADAIILKYNGEKTIQKICGIIIKHIKHVRIYL